MRSATRRKTGRDKAYLIFIRSLACCVCTRVRVWNVYLGIYRTEAAHVGDRGLSVKCPDRETIPLCSWHHRLSPESVHRLGKKFWTLWKLDREKLFARYQAMFEEQL